MAIEGRIALVRVKGKKGKVNMEVRVKERLRKHPCLNPAKEIDYSFYTYNLLCYLGFEEITMAFFNLSCLSFLFNFILLVFPSSIFLTNVIMQRTT